MAILELYRFGVYLLRFVLRDVEAQGGAPPEKGPTKGHYPAEKRLGKWSQRWGLGVGVSFWGVCPNPNPKP